MTVRRIGWAMFPLWMCAVAAEPAAAPAHARWARIELSFQGPDSKGLGAANPFAIPFDVVFTHSAGTSYRVPGFYDGDGRGGMDGRIWKARFAADRNGRWTWRTVSPSTPLNGKRGTFEVVDPPAGTPELFRAGRLEYVGKRYLKFQDGDFWIKAGADEPENILGNAFGRNDWEAKKRQVDYLAAAGINSAYIMTHTLDGDGNDVWPWYGGTGLEVRLNKDRYDVAKLAKWADFFEYVQRRGLVIQMVLEDDSAWSGYDHRRYYREIVARFGYLPAIYFNFCEEYNERYSLAEALAHMKTLAAIDPYRHPRAIHNIREPDTAYLDSANVNVTSIQTQPESPTSLNRLAVAWSEMAALRGVRMPVVSFDEARPAADRRSWWAVYMGGGMWESYVPAPSGYAALQPLWTELARAHRFMRELPFSEMHPANSIVRAGEAFCLARPADVYACYLPNGGDVGFNLPAGNHYKAEWFDPAADAAADWREGGTHPGGAAKLRAPSMGDWALRITKISGQARVMPAPAGGHLNTSPGKSLNIHLRTLDGSAPPFPAEITSRPQHGSIRISADEAVYSPRPGFAGEDFFSWRFRSIDGVSETATVRLNVVATGANKRPYAKFLSVETQTGKPVSVILPYEDPDGPGPHRIAIVRQPAKGKLTGRENDVIYTPADGFKGLDHFEWAVTDAAGARSPRARLEVIVK